MKRFSLSGRANGYYTFDRSITNFFEMRPWTALQLNIPIAANINFRQKLRYEWRLFYTEEEPPLEAGPVLSYAEYFTMDENYPYIAKGKGCYCPKEATKTVVKAV